MKRLDIKFDLSIGIIVKNKEKYLEDCLKSLLPLKNEISCEIIVTDTGSTDKTLKIAKKYADTILNFDWCDDFSAARNTGIKSSAGRWFMIVDADEVFDESVEEIAKFIKSKDCDKYDCATYTQRNYSNKQSKNYTDFISKRLYNFKDEKKYFQGIINEYIETNDNLININAIVKHYEDIPKIINDKNQRDETLLKKQLESNPNDISVYKYLIDIFQTDEKIELANKAIDFINNDKDNNYKNIQHSHYIFLIYCQLAYKYSELELYDLVIETCEKYLNHELVSNFKLKNILPTLEITYMYAYALFAVNRFQASLDTIINYQKKYLHLKDVQDSVFEKLYVYKYNNKFEYSKSLIFVLDCYDKLKDEKVMIKALKQFEAYKTNDTKIKTYLLNSYVEYLVKYNQLEMFDDVENYFNSKEDIYNNSEFVILFYANFMLRGNIDIYLKNCNCSRIINYIELSLNKNDSNILDNLFKLITNRKLFSNLKEMFVFINLMELYLINKSQIIIEENDNETETEKYKINNIFELYIKNMYLYTKTVYNNDILNSKQWDLLEEGNVFGYLIYEAFEEKNNNNLVEYIKIVKEALVFSPKFKNTVSIIVDTIQNVANNTPSPPKPNNEFSLIGEKIKLTIIDAIKINDLEKAKLIIEEYKKINPTDPDIASLLNLVN